MNTKTYFHAKDYWNTLSEADRLELLLKNNFWVGFKTYLWDYVPEEVKSAVMLKIEGNPQNL